MNNSLYELFYEEMLYTRVTLSVRSCGPLASLIKCTSSIGQPVIVTQNETLCPALRYQLHTLTQNGEPTIQLIIWNS